MSIFPYLPKNRKIEFVSEENAFMQKARFLAQTYSTDKNHPTGAVVVKNGKIIGNGWNHSCVAFSHFLVKTHPKWCFRKFFKIPTGKGYFLCPGCTSFKNHAEALAIKDAQKQHQNTANADLYLWGHWWCCQPCWEKMIRAKIKNVYLVLEAFEKFGKMK